jgi:hypothetical protein
VEEVDMPTDLAWEWESLECSIGGVARPVLAWILGGERRLSNEVKQKLEGPKIYRFLITTKLDDNTPEVKEAYVGQSENFLKRIQRYRAGMVSHAKGIEKLRDMAEFNELEQTARDFTGSNTQKRIATRLKGSFEIKAYIEIQTLRLCRILINRQSTFTLDDISSCYIRCMIENIAILKTREDYFLWNKCRDTDLKNFFQLLSKRKIKFTHSNVKLV